MPKPIFKKKKKKNWAKVVLKLLNCSGGQIFGKIYKLGNFAFAKP